MITYETYQNTDPKKAGWCVHVEIDGKSRLVFFGETEEEAMGKATKWVNTSLDTPERQEMLRQRAARLADYRAKKKAKKAVNEDIHN